MNFSNIPHEPLVALLAGILILLVPRLLNYVIAIYLIIIGILGRCTATGRHDPESSSTGSMLTPLTDAN